MKKSLLFLLLTSFLFTPLFSQEEGVLFQFKQNKGDSTSHVSEVIEEAYFNGYLNNQTQFINRMTTTIEEELQEGAAKLKTTYMTTQNSLVNGYNEYLTWGEESTVHINRSKNGQLYNSDTEDLPTVRGVPSFPNKKVRVGETWRMKGEEVHDCKELFNMDEVIRVPFTADYKYMGKYPYENSTEKYDVISVYYTLYQSNFNNRLYKKGTFRSIEGEAAQTIYWDSNKNDLAHYEEEFQIEMFDTYGNSYYFVGQSGGEVTEYHSMNTDEQVQKIIDTVESYDLEDVTVSKGEKGLTISLENIQFEPDSDVLLESEKIKLQKIGEILKSVSNDLLITGHCAHRGTANARQKLSEERAKSVAEYLVQLNVRDKKHIYTQGKGSTMPLASNDSEEGRRKNRRVEITIMD